MKFWRRWQDYIAPIWNYRVTRPLLALFLYTLIALFFTHPIPWNLSTGVMGQAGDAYQHLWKFWWAQKAIIENGTTLAAIDYLYYPQGAHHPIMWVTPWIQLSALPLVVLFGPIFTYNFVFILATALTGLFTYFLAYEITRNHYAAFVGGLIFAFAPTRFIHALGHYAQIQTYLFPLYLFFLVRLLKKPTWRNSLFAAVALAAASLVNFLHIAYVVIPSTVIIVGYYIWRWGWDFWQPRRFWGLAATAALALILVSPFYYPFLKAQFEQELSYLHSPGVTVYGADLLAFITPSPLHPVMEYFPELRRQFAQVTNVGFDRDNITEGLIYLGIAPLLLAGWGIFRQRERAAPWFWLALITAILSLGPLLWVNGRLVTYVVDDISSHIILPYALLTELPLFEFARTPGRINTTTMIALAVLVSIGVAAILQQWSPSPARRRLFIAGVSLIILFEYIAIWPFPISFEPVPEFYQQVAQEPGDFGILDYPVYLLGYRQSHSHDYPLYYQLVHERPIMGGYVWRMPPETLGTLEAFHNLLHPEPLGDIVPRPSDEQVAETLEAMDIGYVIVHKFDTHTGRRAMPPEELEETRRHFANLIGQPVYEDERILAFPVPASGRQGDRFMMAFGDNWFHRDFTAEGIGRWTLGAQSRLFAYGRLERQYHLSFWARTLEEPRYLEVLVNGESVGSVFVDDWRQVILPPFAMNERVNEITLRSSAPCQPFDHPYESDICVNVWISQIELLPAGDVAWGQHPALCDFGEQIRLLGYDLEPESPAAGDRLELTLYWQALQPLDASYTAFNHLLNTQEWEMAGQSDAIPMNLPTNQWSPGEIIVDSHTLLIPDTAAGQSYFLNTGLYEWMSGQRLPITNACPAASPDQYITLSTLTVE